VATSLQAPVALRPAPRSGCLGLFFQRTVGLGSCFKLLLKNRNRPPMVIRSIFKIHNSRSPKQIKDGCYESLKKTNSVLVSKRVHVYRSRSRPQRNNLIFKINFKKKNSVLVSKRVHPRFRTLTTGFLSEDLVSGPQRRVFFLGTSFQVRLEVWTGY